MTPLSYRAGARALRRLRERRLRLSDLRGLVLPATGPRWILASGFDRALIEAGFAAEPRGPAERPLLIGASAGAWRALALTARDPLRAHERLLESYCEQRFRRGDSPAHISAAYRALLEGVVDVGHALEHPALDLVLTVVRARAWGRALARPRMLASMLGAAALNLVARDSTQWFFERVVFHTERAEQMLGGFRGRRVALSAENLHAVALASGTVPVYMEPVLDLPGAGAGGYLDGGLADYHVNQPLRCAGGVIAMFSHQARVVPGWFDKSLGWRESADACSDLLVAYPTPEFIQSLPGGRVPTRDDFFEFEREPELRIRRWREVALRSRELGAAFLEDLGSGRIAEQARAI
ncbi:MAG TPA: patatin-like phospholipase family protein [Polyangiales bacterium]|nr:patatin-like phospholipase family protein [Polyangiales bacterium]